MHTDTVTLHKWSVRLTIYTHSPCLLTETSLRKSYRSPVELLRQVVEQSHDELFQSDPRQLKLHQLLHDPSREVSSRSDHTQDDVGEYSRSVGNRVTTKEVRDDERGPRRLDPRSQGW